MKLSRIAVALSMALVLTGEASAQRRIERFNSAESTVSAGPLSVAPHADWRARTTVLVVGGAAAGILAGGVYAIIECAGEEVIEGTFGDEDPSCEEDYAPPMIVGGLVGGLAGFLLDVLIGHPHESDVAP